MQGQGPTQLVGGQRRQETKAAHVDAQQRRPGGRALAGHAQHGAVASEDQEQIAGLADRPQIGQRRTVQPGQAARRQIGNHAEAAGSGQSHRGAHRGPALGVCPCWPPIRCNVVCQGPFSMQARNSRLPAGPRNGEQGDADPAAMRQLADELFKFRQHTLVHRGIGDDTPSACGFGSSSLELRFDQRDDSSVRFQQFNRRRQDLAQGNERAIDHRKVGGPRLRGKTARVRCRALHPSMTTTRGS
jgi:hypothetical protein